VLYLYEELKIMILGGNMVDKVIEEIVKSEGDVAIATVISSKGSSPSRVGAKMMVREDGSIVGTVGGGSLEGDVIKQSLKCIEEKTNVIVHIDMTSSDIMSEGLICGGVVDVFVEYIKDKTPYEVVYENLLKSQSSTLVYDVEYNKGLVAVLDEDGECILGDVLASFDKKLSISMLEDHLFYDKISLKEKMIIFGGGHVGQAVSKMALELGFDVYVADTRKEFSGQKYFAKGVKAVGGESFTKIIEEFAFDSSTYAIVVSPGHLADLECARAILKKNKFKYFGLMGSKRKISMIQEKLVEDGVSKETFERMHSPIGIKIGAITPSEIAFSILSEVISVRRQGDEARS
jgi:xanthine dehydrogenase accessory factor